MAVAPPKKLRITPVQWVICVVAAIGFAFDIYALLVLPLIVRPALMELGGSRIFLQKASIEPIETRAWQKTCWPGAISSSLVSRCSQRAPPWQAMSETLQPPQPRSCPAALLSRGRPTPRPFCR
jgi:hypothetical protein